MTADSARQRLSKRLRRPSDDSGSDSTGSTSSGGASGSKASVNPVMAGLARAGLAAQGVEYLLIGIIALEIAFGSSSQQADKTGALRLVGSGGFGEVVLWLLVIGFFGMVLWQGAQAIWGAAEPDGHKATKRLAAAGKAVVYAGTTFSVLEYALGLGAPSSSDKESQDATAKLLHYPGGQVLVVIIGLVLVATPPRLRSAVMWLGVIGGLSRAVIAVVAGVFLVIAGIDVQPNQAKGIDSALRALARTPAGPWLLAVVAAGLVLFGCFCFCAARWRKV